MSVLSVATATGRRFLTDQTYQSMLHIMGIVIALIGLYFIYSAHRLHRVGADPG